MRAPMYYAESGFRTRRSVMWMTSAMVIAHLNMLLLRGAREGPQPAIIAGLIWLIVVLLTTSRSLRQLEVLEEEHLQPTASMKLAFQLTWLLPIVGTLPLLFPFLRNL